MELVGHVGVALTVYAPVAYVAVRRGRTRRAWLGLLGVLALSTSPDVDLYVAGVAHRGVTHTVWTVLVAGVAVALSTTLLERPGRRTGPGLARFGGIVGASSVASHLLGDAITPMGIRPFLPVSGTSYTLSLTHAADQRANLALLVVGVLVFAIAVDRATGAGRGADPGPSIEADGGRGRRESGRTE